MKRPCVIRREIRAGCSHCHISRLYCLSEMIFKNQTISPEIRRDSANVMRAWERKGADLSVLWSLNSLGAWKCVYTTDG